MAAGKATGETEGAERVVHEAVQASREKEERKRT